MNNLNIKKPTHTANEIHEMGIKIIESSPFADVILNHVKESGGNTSKRLNLMPTIVYTIADMMSQGATFEQAFKVSKDQLELMGI